MTDHHKVRRSKKKGKTVSTENEPQTGEATATTPEATATESSVKEELLSLVQQLRTVANAVPTHGVTDSHAHGATIHKIADRLVALSEEV